MSFGELKIQCVQWLGRNCKLCVAEGLLRLVVCKRLEGSKVLVLLPVCVCCGWKVWNKDLVVVGDLVEFVAYAHCC